MLVLPALAARVHALGSAALVDGTNVSPVPAPRPHNDAAAVLEASPRHCFDALAAGSTLQLR